MKIDPQFCLVMALNGMTICINFLVIKWQPCEQLFDAAFLFPSNDLKEVFLGRSGWQVAETQIYTSKGMNIKKVTHWDLKLNSGSWEKVLMPSNMNEASYGNYSSSNRWRAILMEGRSSSYRLYSCSIPKRRTLR